MADEKDPKDEAAPAAKKPRAPRRKKPAAPEPAAAAGAEATDETATVDEPTGETAAARAAGTPPASTKKPAAKKAAAKATAASDETTADADAPAEPKPKPARRARRKAADEAPAAAPAPKRAAREPGDAPPMVRAHAKYVRTSARKARLVCDHIRGKDVAEARAILAHASRDVARDWSKLLESAVANAEHNHELLGDDLRIHAVKADEGPTLKRFQPRAMGRATKIRKRTSHLSITLTPKDGEH
jgi:ribosomal protein L22